MQDKHCTYIYFNKYYSILFKFEGNHFVNIGMKQPSRSTGFIKLKNYIGYIEKGIYRDIYEINKSEPDQIFLINKNLPTKRYL